MACDAGLDRCLGRHRLGQDREVQEKGQRMGVRPSRVAFVTSKLGESETRTARLGKTRCRESDGNPISPAINDKKTMGY